MIIFVAPTVSVCKMTHIDSDHNQIRSHKWISDYLMGQDIDNKTRHFDKQFQVFEILVELSTSLTMKRNGWFINRMES